jgi:hypothetical protein
VPGDYFNKTKKGEVLHPSLAILHSPVSILRSQSLTLKTPFLFYFIIILPTCQALTLVLYISNSLLQNISNQAMSLVTFRLHKSPYTLGFLFLMSSMVVDKIKHEENLFSFKSYLFCCLPINNLSIKRCRPGTNLCTKTSLLSNNLILFRVAISI